MRFTRNNESGRLTDTQEELPPVGELATEFEPAVMVLEWPVDGLWFLAARVSVPVCE